MLINTLCGAAGWMLGLLMGLIMGYRVARHWYENLLKEQHIFRVLREVTEYGPRQQPESEGRHQPV